MASGKSAGITNQLWYSAKNATLCAAIHITIREENPVPRKQILPENSNNPFQRMFGTYLRLKRVALGYSSDELGNLLGLTGTYLRLVESGKATLNQSLIFRIIEVFGSSRTIRPIRTINFSQFAVFLVGVHWVGAQIASMADTEDAPRRAAETLAAQDANFEIFFDRTKRYFDFEEGSSEQKDFLERVAAPEVELFLTSDPYGRFDIRTIQRELLELPSLNVELWAGFKDSLAGRTFIHTGEFASQWEAQHTSEFYSFQGIYRRSDLVLNEEHFRYAVYGYLAMPRFRKLQMIFLDAETDPAGLKDDFVGLLQAGRAKRRVPHPPVSPEEASKIHFVCPQSEARERFAAQLENLLGYNGKQDAYWSLQTHEGFSHGFAARDGAVANVQLGYALANVDTFTTAWNGISEAIN